jgi:hypothetical protein
MARLTTSLSKRYYTEIRLAQKVLICNNDDDDHDHDDDDHHQHH